jgi:Polyketide cyclase / dehydrase and lipid transport
MTSICKEIPIDAPAVEVWDAVRDFGALHTRLVPGFVVDTRLDGEARIVTFANGTVVRELLVDCDDARQRLAYAIVSERVRHYNGSVEIVPDGEARCRVIWIVDVLPHEIAPFIGSQMDLGVAAMQKAFAKDRLATSA